MTIVLYAVAVFFVGLVVLSVLAVRRVEQVADEIFDALSWEPQKVRAIMAAAYPHGREPALALVYHALSELEREGWATAHDVGHGRVAWSRKRSGSRRRRVVTKASGEEALA